MTNLEAEDLACVVTELPEGSDYEEIDTALYEKFGIDLPTFSKVAASLLVLTPKVQLAITKKVVHAFIKDNTIIARNI